VVGLVGGFLVPLVVSWESPVFVRFVDRSGNVPVSPSISVSFFPALPRLSQFIRSLPRADFESRRSFFDSGPSFTDPCTCAPIFLFAQPLG